MSRLQFTTGAGHRRGRAHQTRPMRSRRPPCYQKGASPEWVSPSVQANLNHCARFSSLARAIDETDSSSYVAMPVSTCTTAYGSGEECDCSGTRSQCISASSL